MNFKIFKGGMWVVLFIFTGLTVGFILTVRGKFEGIGVLLYFIGITLLYLFMGRLNDDGIL